MEFKTTHAYTATVDRRYRPQDYYLYCRRRPYSLPQVGHPLSAARGLTRYDFSSDYLRPPPERGSQAVEDVVYQGYFSIPASEGETDILSDRRHTTWLGLDDLIQQIKFRYEIYHRNMYEIEQGKCNAINDLFAWETATALPASPEQRVILGRRLEGLYANQRQERAQLWKDISTLRQALPESAQRYLSVHRKLQILGDPGGASP